jgi:hypothetical protein
MDRTEAIKSSIKKWHPGIWNDLTEMLENWGADKNDREQRYQVFRDVLWESCGFCRIYKDRKTACDSCPLSPDYCHSSLSRCQRGQRVVGEILDAWENNEVNVFHYKRRKLVKFMASQLIHDGECDCDMCEGIGVVNG